MVEYSIKAYPTEYSGRTYRSRLEARWAAFFDLLGWKHEYEPFDLGKWSPDFLLPDASVLVEVKPITSFCEETFYRMRSACEKRGMFDPGEDGPTLNGILLLGVSPIVEDAIVTVGWYGCSSTKYNHLSANLLWIGHRHHPEFSAHIVHVEKSGWWTADGDASDWEDLNFPRPYVRHTMELWARGTGMVQWRPE